MAKESATNPNTNVMIQEINREENGKFVFGGPQGERHPDSTIPPGQYNGDEQPEFIIKPITNFRTTESAHEADPESYRLKEYHQEELDSHKVVPDFYVDLTDRKFYPDRGEYDPYKGGQDAWRGGEARQEMFENIMDDQNRQGRKSRPGARGGAQSSNKKDQDTDKDEKNEEEKRLLQELIKKELEKDHVDYNSDDVDYEIGEELADRELTYSDDEDSWSDAGGGGTGKSKGGNMN